MEGFTRWTTYGQLPRAVSTAAEVLRDFGSVPGSQ
jgi:hypothetical protein